MWEINESGEQDIHKLYLVLNLQSSISANFFELAKVKKWVKYI